VPVRNSLYVLRAVDLRSSLLRAGEVLDQAALDKYSFTRDAYLQRRGVVIETNGDTEERYDLPEAPSPAPAR
jgi:phospholipid-binding lipoprotein MlaA